MSRVVVIDDYEPTLRMYATAIEKMLGGEVVAFSDPREALHYMSAMDPTLCVVDYSMPEMDGVAFVQELRGVPGRERTPIIMLTGKDDRDLRSRAMSAGVSVFLNKPVSAEEFAGHVRRLATQNNAANVRDGEMRDLKERAESVDRRLHQRDREAIDAVYRTYAARYPDAGARMKQAAEIAVMLAIEVRCSVADVQLLREGAHVYDIGKLAIPDKTLASTAKLSATSRVAVERHADAGAEILAVSESRLFAAASTMARTHHERWDGEGYPRKLKGDAIPLSGRLIAVADALVAMMNARPDRPAMAFGHALDQIKRESGTHFDPAVVSALERIKDKVAQLRA
ncbi:MAG TPA: HD domain-containing phosphohydrolase [Candidatus Baltobacteraceae bacterium]|nr:HD domain-containing phosphohydrolase [Candidatus Baltobacteraceae bacterium]